MNTFDPNHHGPFTEEADALHAMKYRGRGEDFEEYANRVAFGMADNGTHYHALRSILLPQRFLPGGRIQGAMGATRQTTAFNCFVAPTIEDTYVDGPNSIMGVAHQAAATMRMGGGIGYDFSTLRPRGFRVMKLESNATGPVSFMDIFDAVGLATASSGHRRGAQMGVLRVDHPDIEEFIYAKQNTTRLKGFNISVGVTDEFMRAALEGKPFKLTWGGIAHREVDAAEIWEKIMRSTWDWADPGVMFLDRINEMNNLYYCEKIAATNPCGEQPLPPHGACLLGSFNLVRYLRRINVTVPTPYWDMAPGTDPWAVDWVFDFDQLKDDIPHVVRAMDNVIDRTRYPLPQQAEEAKAKRRMGLGVTGLANAGEATAGPYGSKEFLMFEHKVLETIKVAAYRASVELAKDKGAFKLFDAQAYVTGMFIRTLPDDLVHDIKVHGIRNSHLTSIAPTGTISMAADNVSSALEPVFAHSVQRSVNTPDGMMVRNVGDFGSAYLGVRGKVTAEVTVDEHIAVLCTAQSQVDSAVSKTCNHTGSIRWEDFKDIYRKAWEGGAKGCTTFNTDGKRGALLTDGATCEVGPDGVRDCN